MSEHLPAPVGFQGQARLFPLPNLVLFPHAVQPLHIFEPRYRLLIGDALDGDRLVAMVLLKPGWEANYDGSPAIYPVACLGKIVAEQKLKDGCFNILLRGLARINLVAEIDQGKKYRQAQVEILPECFAITPGREKKLRQQILRQAAPWFANSPKQGNLLDYFRQLLNSNLQLSTLCDILAFALPFDIHFKQELLGQQNVGRRAAQLLQKLTIKPARKSQQPLQPKFPPEFSVN